MIRDLPLTPERVWRALRDAGGASPTVTAAERSRSMTYAFALDAPPCRHARRGQGARRRQGREPRGHGARARAAGAAGLRDHDRDLPDASSRAAGRPASTTSCATRMAEVEAAVGRRFGDPSDPLLVSVRSGAPGLDARDDGHDPEPRAERRDDGRPGPCSRRRRVRPELSRALRGELPVDRRRRRRPGRTRGCQLRLAIEAVFRSWNSDRARAYRQKEGIPDDLGTAVTVQAMVFGNRGPTSATGVAVHAQPGDRRADPLRRRHVRRPGRGRRRRHASDRADRRPRRAAAGRRRRAARRTRRGWSATTPTCATSSSRSRTAGSGCSRSASASAARRRRCGSPSTWPRTRRSRCRGPRRSSACAAAGRPADARRALGSSFVLPLATGLPASPGHGERPDRRPARRPPRRGCRGGRAGHPRPRRDLARRRPRHGRGGRDPDLARRPREPRRGRRPRLGDPRRRRRGTGIEVARRARSSIGERTLRGRRRHHDRRQHRRGLRGRHPGHDRGRAGGPDAARLGATSSGSRSAARPARHEHSRRAASGRSAPSTPSRPQGDARRTACASSRSRASPRSQGVADAVLADAGRRPADPRPARARRARRDGRRRATG